MSFCSQQLLHLSRDKSVKLAQQYSKVHWLKQYNASLLVQLGKADTLMSDLGLRDRVWEVELARAIDMRDAQRAAAEQKAREIELQVAALQQKDVVLEAKEAELQHEMAAITTLTDTLVQKDVVLETREVAICDAETTLKEGEASLSALQQQVDAAWELL